MSEKILSHRDLKVWEKAVDLVDALYELSDRWPRHEQFTLTSQIRRAAISVPSNIAEGNGRNTTRDYLRFLSTSYGSLMEVDTQVCIARRRQYITETEESRLVNQVSEIGRMLNGLQASLERRIHGERPNHSPATDL